MTQPEAAPVLPDASSAVVRQPTAGAGLRDDPQTQDPAGASDPEAGEGFEEIVITARLRPERLLDVPVSVTALSQEDLVRYQTDTLGEIGELTPGLVIGNTQGSGSGGSIAVRGISSASSVIGFEQPISVVIDGVPVSGGWITSPSFFDIGRVEVLKGPQALLFGKNNTAGVISLVSASPTNNFEGYVRASYEFVGDEATVDTAISGPITSTLKARLALRVRNMEGWVYNTAGPIANPFLPAFPLVEPDHKRFGEKELTGRLTLVYEPTDRITSTLKVFGSHRETDGPALGNQVVGGCGPEGRPRIANNVDPYGDCERDNRVSQGQINPGLAALYPGSNGGKDFGRFDSLFATLNTTVDLDAGAFTSITGYVYYDTDGIGNFDNAVFAQLVTRTPQRIKAFTQELRYLSQYDSPLNFMVGAFYQDQDFDPYRQLVKIRDNVNYNPARGSTLAWDKLGFQFAKTYSAFGQLIYEPIDKVEITGGLRYTREQKDSSVVYNYANQPNSPQGVVISDEYRDSNLSPEATISYRPNRDTTIFAAYRTGYKSGGFALSSSITNTSTPEDFNFEAEKTSGFEVGAKGLFLNRRLRLEATAYRYEFTDLQVNAYDPTRIQYSLSNAGSLKQMGVDVQVGLRAARGFDLRAAVNWNRNRFGDYAGQCYGGQTAALGCNLPGPAQNFDGRAPARSPDWSGNAGASYSIPLGGFELALSADAFYTDNYFASETLAPSTRQDDYWRLNAAVRLLDDASGWSLGVVGRNLTNEYVLLIAADKTGQVGEQRGTVARGREVSVEGSYRF